MPSREMEIDRGLFQIVMSQEQLNGAQISSVFQQVSSKTVAQRVGMNPVLKARPLGSTLARIPHRSGSDGTMGGVPGPARKQPFRGFALQATPVVAQGFEQPGTEHDISVLTPLPAADVDHHPSAVDIGNLQASQLSAPCSRAVESHQYHAMKPSLGRVDEAGNFFLAQDA